MRNISQPVSDSTAIYVQESMETEGYQNRLTSSRKKCQIHDQARTK